AFHRDRRAVEQVVARSAVPRFIVVAARQKQHVVALVAVECVAPRAAAQEVIVVLAAHDVAAPLPVHRVSKGRTVERVVLRASVEQKPPLVLARTTRWKRALALQRVALGARRARRSLLAVLPPPVPRDLVLALDTTRRLRDRLAPRRYL